MFFSRETRAGLAPRSWPAVGVWLLVIGIFAARPIATASWTYTTIRSTGKWAAYYAFAECGDEPPMDWMEPKACEPLNNTDDPVTAEPPTTPPDPDDLPSAQPDTNTDEREGYVITVDETAITDVLDTTKDAVLDLHAEVEQIQDNGGLTVEIGNQGSDQ
ncbi:MAG: hypothetical protein AAF467_24620 [Actinomycetota bacterium]